ARPALAGAIERERLADKLGKDVGRALLARHHPDALPRHQRAGFNVALDHRAAQSPRPEMLDFELRLLLHQLTAVEAVDNFALDRAEPLGRRVRERAHRYDRKPRIELGREHRIARRRADEGALEAGMGD